MDDFGAFFERIPPADFHSAMKRSEVINGQHRLNGGCLRPSPLTCEQEARFAGAYAAWVAATKAFNVQARTRDQAFIDGQTLHFHLPVMHDQDVVLRFSGAISAAKASVHDVLVDAPYVMTAECGVRNEDARIEVTLPRGRLRQGRTIRRTLTLAVWTSTKTGFGSFRLESELG